MGIVCVTNLHRMAAIARVWNKEAQNLPEVKIWYI